MDIAYLGIVFCTIIGLLTMKRPLYQAVTGGLVVTAVLFRMPLVEIASRAVSPFTKWSSFSLLLVFYLITFLQRILEARKQIKLAQGDLDRLFNNRRVNAAGAPLFIGLLPSAAAMVLCSDIVKESTDGYLTPREQAAAASWFRHIPESTLPTYTGVLLMISLSGVALPQFMVGMIVPVLILATVGYIAFLRKVPKETGVESDGMKLADWISLVKHLWPLLLVLTLIIGFGVAVVWSVLISILVSVFAYRITGAELKVMFRSAFDKKILSNTYLVLVLKEFITYTGVMEQLPDAMAGLPLPPYLIFGILFFVATLISGTAAAIAMGTPLAFAVIPGGMPLMVYLMCMAHAASQLSPTHVCLVVASDYFNVSMGEVIRKTVPLSLTFCVLVTVYYNVLMMVL